MTASPLSVSVSRVVAAPPTRMYDLVSDLTTMPEYSPETVAVRWLEGATHAAIGARFKGSNRIGWSAWSTKPTVVTAEPGSRFAFQVPGRGGPLWTYEFQRAAGGTLVTESMVQTEPSPAVIRLLRRMAGVTDRAEHLRQGMLTTLDRLAVAAERQMPATVH